MEDKRIKKTKNNVKQTLMALLNTKPFDKITITELCDAASMSRITFYTHYADKYELIDDVLKDLLALTMEDFTRLQRENNPKDDALTSYYNVLDSILNLYESHAPFLQQMSQKKNPYLYYACYNYVYENIKLHVERESEKLIPLLGSKRFSAFLCNGLWAFINECYDENCDSETIRNETHALLQGILQSNLFFKKI